MLWQTVAFVLLAPFVACGATWVLWMGLVSCDWVFSALRGWNYSRRIKHCPPFGRMQEPELAQRVWESYWMLKNCRLPRGWNRDQLHEHMIELQEQLHLLQVSREAYELWQGSSQSQYYPSSRPSVFD